MSYDLIVIGGGSGGVRAARIAATFGAKVAIIEDTFWGGTCVNVGCVPKKLYHYASSIKNTQALATAYGWDMQLGEINWQTFHDNKDKEINRLNSIYGKMLANAGCEVIDGHGKLLSATQVQVSRLHTNEQNTNNNDEATEGAEQFEILEAKKIILAVGGTPYMPDIEGIEHAINSDELFRLKHLPKRMLVVGGGYIACEMASIYHKLGCEVTLAVRSQLLKAFDREAVEFLETELVNDGLHINKGITPVKLSKINTDSNAEHSGNISVTFDDGSVSEYDEVLFATGRKPRFDGLGLENTDVTLDDNGFIAVDENFQTAEANIYAVGDIIDGLELTPVALEQGMYLAKHLFAQTPLLKPAFESVATAIFTHPQLATVGMSEEQAQTHARQTGEKVVVFTSSFRHIKYTITDIQKRTFIKLMTSATTDKILGIQMVGEEVGEIIQGFAVLMHTGITKQQLDQTIGVHPTVAEELVTMREPTRVI